MSDNTNNNRETPLFYQKFLGSATGYPDKELCLFLKQERSALNVIKRAGETTRPEWGWESALKTALTLEHLGQDASCL